MSNEELVAKYSNLAGYFAWDMVKRSPTLGSEDAEDFASTAIISLLKCPPQFRTEEAYVKRLLLNSVIKSWRSAIRHSEINTSLEVLLNTSEESYEQFVH